MKTRTPTAQSRTLLLLVGLLCVLGSSVLTPAIASPSEPTARPHPVLALLSPGEPGSAAAFAGLRPGRTGREQVRGFFGLPLRWTAEADIWFDTGICEDLLLQSVGAEYSAGAVSKLVLRFETLPAAEDLRTALRLGPADRYERREEGGEIRVFPDVGVRISVDYGGYALQLELQAPALSKDPFLPDLSYSAQTDAVLAEDDALSPVERMVADTALAFARALQAGDTLGAARLTTGRLAGILADESPLQADGSAPPHDLQLVSIEVRLDEAQAAIGLPLPGDPTSGQGFRLDLALARSGESWRVTQIRNLDLQPPHHSKTMLEPEAADALGPAGSLPAEGHAIRLREEGMERLGRGDYAGALERLEASLGLLPDAELADRVARLRAYMQLRGL